MNAILSWLKLGASAYRPDRETGASDAPEVSDSTEELVKESQTEEEKKEMLIGAHEDLVKIDESNLAKFQDLLTFLKNEE